MREKPEQTPTPTTSNKTKKGKGKVVVSWTGGKDGCFSCYKALIPLLHIDFMSYEEEFNLVNITHSLLIDLCSNIG